MSWYRESRLGTPPGQGAEFFQTLLRELREEAAITGVDIDWIRRLGLLTPDHLSYVYTAFHVHTKIEGIEPRDRIPIDDESQKVRLVDPETIGAFLKEEGNRITPDRRENLVLLLKHDDSRC